MSADDMVFDEIKYREPKKARRPDRDRRFACVAYEVPGAKDMPIFLDLGPADFIERHALRDTSVELGGILLGTECVDDQTGEPFVWVTECLEAKHYENTQASFTYTHETWGEITRERDEKYPDLDIVGWYHTHPDFGIFLSSHDLFIHRNFFDQPLQVAYVVDPIRQTRGFFRWRDGGLEQVGGYYLSSDRNDRVALARLVNDLESIPNADSGGGGGGITPRLEAELIAMLSRPHTSQGGASLADRAQLASLFGTIGLLAGVILIGVGAWLYTMTQSVREQTATLADLRKSIDQSDQVERAALKALLRKEGSGQTPTQFVDSLASAERDLAEATADARHQKTAATVQAAEVERLQSAIALLQKEKTEVKSKADAAAIKVDELLVEAKATKSQLATLLTTDAGGALVKYNSTWWAAATGWVLAVLATLGLVAVWASRTEPEPAGPQVPFPINPGPPESPHQIV